MEIRKAIGGSPGYAIVTARVLDREEFSVRKQFVEKGREKAEAERFNEAHRRAVVQMSDRLAELSSQIGPVVARIIEGHVAMLSEEPLRKEIEGLITRHAYTAEYAVSRAFRSRLKALEDSGQDFWAQRIRQDFVEIENALMRSLMGGASPEETTGRFWGWRI